MKLFSTFFWIGLAALIFSGCGRKELLIVGTLERTRVELAAPVSETIFEIPCKEGQIVKKGDLVIQLDPAVTRAQYESAKAQAELSKLDLQRGDKLIQQQVISQEEYDRLVHNSASKVAQADELKTHLDQLSLRAPTDAVVDEIPFEIGERPKAGDIVAVLLAKELPYARVYIPEGQVPYLHPGDEAEVKVDGLNRWLKARVRKIAQSASYTPHFALTDREKSRLVFEAEIDIVDPEARNLRIGVPLKVKLHFKS